VLAGFAALAACNVVTTKAPLFTAADAAGAPPLRPGVWLFFKDADCPFDEARPFTEWPDCAAGGLVSAGDVQSRNAHDPHGPLEHNPFIMAGGDPRIVQLVAAVDVTTSASASGSGDAQVSTSASASTTVTQDNPYSYAGLRPTRLDAQGRIVAFKVWPVECGPPPPKDAHGNDVAPATLHPYPGIEMKPGDTDCTTHSQADLRAAALDSEADASPMQGHWVRDGDR
jgi:hypothetical protein